MKYKTKPCVIEAWEFTMENKDRTYHDLVQIHGNVQPSRNENGDPILLIPTLEGEMTASIGDYIIKGLIGELYPCKPEVFHKKYEPAEQDGGAE